MTYRSNKIVWTLDTSLTENVCLLSLLTECGLDHSMLLSKSGGVVWQLSCHM